MISYTFLHKNKFFHAVWASASHQILSNVYFCRRSACALPGPHTASLLRWLRVNSEGYEHERKKLSCSREHYVLLSFITREGVESLKSGY